MKRCAQCELVRQDGSFDPNTDICKACVHRPCRAGVRKDRGTATRDSRTQAAIRYVVKQYQTANESYVYLVKIGERYKIGYSTNVNARIRHMETGSSDVLQIVAVAPGGRQLEHQLHEFFRGHRIKGEWFAGGNSKAFIQRFAELPGAMVFLQGYVKQEAPESTVTDLPLTLAL